MLSIALTAMCLAKAPSESVLVEELECQVAISADTAFEDRWYYTLDAEMRITASDEVFRRQYFGVFLFLTGFEVDEERRAGRPL